MPQKVDDEIRSVNLPEVDKSKESTMLNMRILLSRCSRSSLSDPDCFWCVVFGRRHPRRLGHCKSASAARAQAGHSRWVHDGFAYT